ncbi:MAG: hypothetical protein GX856_05470, partial [Gammaproteobacteria bacterium]|nr:hypothetical protein [Gammaproteobacteria bacterium]
MSLAPRETAPLGAGTGLEELLDGVREFAQAEIDARTPVPDVPLTGSGVSAIEQAAVAAGLLDDEPGGTGLWAGDAERAQFSVLALRILARSSAAAALHLHNTALARRVCNTLWDCEAAPGTTLTLTGRLGLPGAALGRWLAGHELDADDHSVLADAYGGRERIRWTTARDNRWITARYATDGDGAGTMTLSVFAGGGEELPAAHGLDGLAAIRQPAAAPERSEPVDPATLSELLFAQQLGVVAVAQGATDAALRLARAYAVARRQGGGPIIAHDAVALMLADAAGAQQTVAGGVSGILAGTGPARDLAAVVDLRRAALPALRTAVDHAMQVHGGIGYMRDTGVEHRWRDLGSLSVLAGTPDQLGLLSAALRMPGAARHEPGDLGAGDRIAGHVSPMAVLALQPALRRQPLLRATAAYRPEDPWERDTRDLPRALRALRRELRDFAATHIEPLALQTDRAGIDSGTRPAQIDALMVTAGRAGLLGDMLPRPVGSGSVARYRSL